MENQLTVRDLIEYLLTLPLDTPVNYVEGYQDHYCYATRSIPMVNESQGPTGIEYKDNELTIGEL